MHKCKEALESDKHIHQVELEEERKELRHIRFQLKTNDHSN